MRSLQVESSASGTLLYNSNKREFVRIPGIIPKYKAASAGAVRKIPAEAFAKGGNSDELQEVS